MNNEFERVVSAAEYVPHRRQLKLTLSDGSEHLIPVACLQMERWNGSTIETLPPPSDSQLSAVRVWGGGHSVLFPELEQVFSAEDLVAGRYGDSKWMSEVMTSTTV